LSTTDPTWIDPGANPMSLLAYKYLFCTLYNAYMHRIYLKQWHNWNSESADLECLLQESIDRLELVMNQ
jgi:hypothetical protein